MQFIFILFPQSREQETGKQRSTELLGASSACYVLTDQWLISQNNVRIQIRNVVIRHSFSQHVK